MNEVKVKTSELLKKLHLNRAAHIGELKIAQREYRKDVIAELDRMLEEARKGHTIRRSLTLPIPQDHTADYDRAILMLEMSVSKTMVIQAHEFDQYVMDNWEWKAAVSASNTFYASKAFK